MRKAKQRANKTDLTNGFIESIGPARAKKRLSFYDSEVPYLMLRVTDKGHKSFSVHRTVRGETLRITIGHFPEMSIYDARQVARKVNDQLERGIDPRPEFCSSKVQNKITVGELFEHYLNEHIKPHRKSLEPFRKNFDRYLSGWKDLPAHLIRRLDVEKLHKKLGQEHGHTTANRVIEMLRAAYNKGIRWDLVNIPNPALGIFPYKQNSRERFLQPDEVERFFNALENEKRKVVKDFVLLALYTGVRSANVMAMRWDQIDFRECTWTIPETKNGKRQTVALVPQAMEILKERYEWRRSAYVLPGTRGKSPHLVNPHNTWYRILKRANIRDFRIHDLRRTLASWQLVTGADLPVIAKTLNHSSIRPTQIYARLNLSSVRQAMEKAVNAMIASRSSKNIKQAKPKVHMSLDHAKEFLLSNEIKIE